MHLKMGSAVVSTALVGVPPTSRLATCHTPVLQTGNISVAALDRKPVRLFSDLLLHNMGTLGDGIAQGTPPRVK